MADQVEEILEVPREFFKDGVQFINRCQKRTHLSHHVSLALPLHLRRPKLTRSCLSLFLADQKEFLKLCQAVGIGFGVMGAVGFIVKLIHIPLNGLLVGSA
ncbi:protein transporter Sec61 subunit gamma [Trichoderma harzianum]|uniref:Protein transporter Sec61 subunit gamma n=1 Tax=Trichoderma harzianum TaxID=5544 RepID=A0A0F9XGQ3_TRIHA|nr:protein transporter Sec61 subunit gamma [Trichoderma harzianum]